MKHGFYKTTRRLIALALICLLSSAPVFAGLTIIGSNGITASGADGIIFNGTSGITASGADGILAFGPNGITASGADGITASGADGITASGADGITISGADSFVEIGTAAITSALNGAQAQTGLQSLDPELAVLLNRLTDDSNVDAVIVYQHLPGDADIADLQRIGVLGGTRYRALPMVAIAQITST